MPIYNKGFALTIGQKRSLLCFVPRAGLEPARIASLVFETNASTNSAIGACIEEHTCVKCGAKLVKKVETQAVFLLFFDKTS